MAGGLAESVLAGARRQPEAIAVADGDRAYSYRELDRTSAAVASALLRRGIGPGDAVAVRLPRSWPLVAVMLGIRRLGATVVPLDGQSPPDRQQYILDDSRSVVVAGADLLDGAIDGQGPEACRPGGPGFLFYTSGTTGQPKGVRVLDAGIERLARTGYLELAGGLRYACLSNPAFDALSFEVWTPLLTGGCCVIVDDETVATPHRLAAKLRQERIDTLFVTTALFNAATEAEPECFASVGQVLVGGEQLNASLIRRWYARNAGSRTQLFNVYGPTEATTFALSYPIPRDFAAGVVPIGRPLPGTRALLVADSRLAGPGEAAELYLGGEALAAGYQNRPAETDRRFVGLPWLDGGAALYYRTGDLVRENSGGLVEYLGRADRQVKVRGFRIEPEEVERRLTAHPAVLAAYAGTRAGAAGKPLELVAYLVTEADLSYAEFERHLAATLPTYMRPHRIYRVAELPRTANGKVDSDALLALRAEPWRPGKSGESATAWQREVLALAASELGGTEPALDESFVAAGGDSLASLRLRFAIRERWGCEVPQAVVLRSDLAGLAGAIAAARAARSSGYPDSSAGAGATSAPATSEQQRLWMLQRQAPGSVAYNAGFAFRVTGPADEDALRAAVRGLVRRHPALRTAFEVTASGLRQTVADPYDPWTPAAEGHDWQEFAGQFLAVPFDLSDHRLLRACWLGERDGGTLLLVMHHIAVDGRSVTVLLSELSAELAGLAPTGLAAPTPLDYSTWQADWLDSPGYLEQRSALREHYAAVPYEPEPLQREGPDAGEARAGLVVSRIGPASRALISEVAAGLGLTTFELLLAVFTWSVYGVTGRRHLRIASPVAGRPAREFESSVGMFANTVLIPLRVVPDEPLAQQAERQAGSIRAVLDRQDVALADVIADNGFPVSGPLFDFMFVLDNTDFRSLAIPGCEVRPAWLPPPGAKCPLTLSIMETADGFDCLWEHDRAYLDSGLTEAMAGLLGRGIDALSAEPGQDVEYLTGPYRAGLPDHGRGPLPELEYVTIADGFARQVRRAPDATAIADGATAISYARLDRYSAALAAELEARFPRPDGGRPAQVALWLEPSLEHVVALLALARLNVTAVPLDPAYPPALLAEVIAQVAPVCVLVSPGSDGPPAPAGESVPRYPVVLSDALGTVPPAEPAGRRPLYTLFTSGSTGTPKGVSLPELTLCNLLQWQAAAGGLPGGAATQQFSMLSFDVSFQEIFGTLCGGGTLHLIRPGWRHDLPALLDQLDVAGIERIYLPYVALQLLAEHGRRLRRFPSRLRDVVTAGEQLLCSGAIRDWLAGMPGARLFNHYGPTETHVVSALRLDGDPAGWPDRPAIGRPVAGTWLRVTDEDGRPVPPGCPGELLIGGVQAVPCYLGDPAMNADRFVARPGEGRFYRSGDLACVDRDGLFHYLGRRDEQVKISGHRVELGQIEAALASHPEVIVATVVHHAGSLVACAEFRAGPPALENLAAHLAARLPSYVKIDRFRQVAALPRTASGKLDRRRSLEVPGTDLRASSNGAVRTARESRLAELFDAVIGQPIEPDQRFFDAGASSLGLMRFHLRATTELGLRMPITDLFEHVTIRDLARSLDHAPAGPPERTERPEQSEPIAIIGMAVRLPGADDLAAFWDLVTSGRSGISFFDAADGLVGARSQMSGLLAFDPGHFGISPAEARLMDPQQRHLLMACVQALAHAGLADPASRRTGIIASCGENTYFQAMLRDGDPAHRPDPFQLALHHDKDFLATKAAYHLGLTGPAFAVQAACASSLVAVHVAAGMLRQGDAEVMLAAGVLADPALTGGYVYRPQHIFSPDGHCRPFSDDANGTIGGSGVAVVVLKPLGLARHDGDTVFALVTGSAVNNDGAAKLSYSAPALAGQREVIRLALRRSGRSAADLGYIEAHGTGTELGDPVEVGALRQALGPDAGTGGIALASVKSQIGHLGAAAGVAGLVRAALAVYHERIPPNADFRALNKKIGADAAPFTIPERVRPWPPGRPRVAAVSSFGIGGTNAHVVIEAGETGHGVAAAPDCLMLSASSVTALRADAARIADFLATRPDSYSKVLRHLQAGRRGQRFKVAATCPDPVSAGAWLRRVAEGAVPATSPVPAGEERNATDGSAQDLAKDWLAGLTIRWPAGPAQPPWDFPPPVFALADYDFVRTMPPEESGAWPARRPEADWLYQPHWVKLRRASENGRPAPTGTGGVLVVVTARGGELPAAGPLARPFRRVVRVSAAAGFRPAGPDAYEVDPADPDSLASLLDAVSGPGGGRVDWLHALPLSVDGPVSDRTLALARWACLDTPAALMRAAEGRPGLALRPWWLSCGAQPVDGEVRRPELGLLAGITAVGPQECATVGHWLDLPDPDPARWTAAVTDLLEAADPDRLPARLALARGYWWYQALLPLAGDDAGFSSPAELPEDGVHVVLGGTGGIGSTVAGWLLEQSNGPVILVARRPQRPSGLDQWADRVEVVPADLAVEAAETIAGRIEQAARRLAPDHAGIVTVVHAAGTASGGLIVRRDAVGAGSVSAAKLGGLLVAEELIVRHRPVLALYCSSMSAQLGGVGQVDYAAANGALDGFARYRDGENDPTLRVSVGWDVWREAGMARDALAGNARHQAHLAVGLTLDEARRVLGRVAALGLPQVLVSVTDLERSAAFYGPEPDRPGAQAEPLEEHLSARLREWLGLDELDPAASLYDLGADSLTLVDLIAEIRDQTGTDLLLSQFNPEVSLAEVLMLAAKTRPAGDDQVPVEIWQEGTGPDLVCLIHPVGGDLLAYRSLVAAIDDRLTVCLIADPGLSAPAPPDWTLAERARRYHAALAARFPNARWRLAGWSFGAWVAIAMAAEAEAAGRPAEAVVLIDPPAPDAGSKLAAYDDAQLETVFAGTGGSRDYAERLARCGRASLASMAGYVPPVLAATPGLLWFATAPTAGLPAPEPADGRARHWGTHLPAGAEWRALDTTHDGIVREPHAAVIGAEISAAIQPALWVA